MISFELVFFVPMELNLIAQTKLLIKDYYCVRKLLTKLDEHLFY